MGINDQEQQLINQLYIQSNEWISSQKLSSILNVSTRQIRNYVKKINSQNDTKIIDSSNLGYKLILQSYHKLHLDKKKEEMINFNNMVDRQSFLIQLLIKKKEPILLDELYERLFVSESTLDRDLMEIEKNLKRFKMYVLKKNKQIQLIGTEKQKRVFVRFTLKKMNFEEFTLLNYGSILTSNYNINTIIWDLKKIFSKNNYYANDYVINNMAIHLIIIIDRIKEGYEISDEDELGKEIHSPILSNLLTYLEQEFSILLNRTEQNNLLMLISNNTSAVNFNQVSIENLHTFIAEKYVRLAKHLMDKVTKEYYLDTFSDEFIVQFTLHISNLFQRLSNNYSIKNPLTIKIKENYPFIYDIAVSMAQEIKVISGATINEDEITFLAFHIGGYFEKNKNRDKLRVFFVVPEYYSMSDLIVETVQNRFSKDLTVVKSVPFSMDYNYSMTFSEEIDLIISSFPIIENEKTIIINPLPLEKDMEHIQEKINAVRKKKKGELFKKNISNLFNETAFFPNVGDVSKKQIIRRMVQHAQSDNLVSNHFEEEIFERESLSETTYNGIAVPHSMTSRNVQKSFISIATAKQGIYWGEKKIYLVILIGIAQEERKTFGIIFEQLIELLLDNINVKKLAVIDDYQQIIEEFHVLIDEQ